MPLASTGYSKVHETGWAAVDRTVRWAVDAIGRPAAFDEIVAILPAGIHYSLILGSLRSFAQCRDGRWRIAQSAAVVDLPSRVPSVTTRKAAA